MYCSARSTQASATTTSTTTTSTTTTTETTTSMTTTTTKSAQWREAATHLRRQTAKDLRRKKGLAALFLHGSPASILNNWTASERRFVQVLVPDTLVARIGCALCGRTSIAAGGNTNSDYRL